MASSRYDDLHDKFDPVSTTKSGTRYERLVALVRKSLDETADVSHDVKLIGGEDTEVKHQIDVRVTHTGQTRRVLIECKDFDVSGDPFGLGIVRDFFGAVDDVKPDEALKIMLHRRSSPDRAATECGRRELATFVFCAILFGSLLGPSCGFTAGAVRLLRDTPRGHADCPSVVPPIVDTAAAIAGLWLGRDAMVASSTTDGKPGLAVALPILAVGATFLVSAIYGYWADGRCLNAEAIDDLGVQAASAARNGDCATVRGIGAQLSVLDSDFYDTVFTHDAAIVRCLAGNVPAPLPMTPAPSAVPASP